MGSKSDAQVMEKASAVLDEFGVESKTLVVSAHRAPDVLAEAVEGVVKAGAEVIIAGAGLSAALPGAIAARSVVPVIGVPLECVSPGLSNGLAGMDALLSIAQMPPQVPVAAVGVGAAKNAAYLALEILGVKHEAVRARLVEFRKKLSDEARERLAESGV